MAAAVFLVVALAVRPAGGADGKVKAEIQVGRPADDSGARANATATPPALANGGDVISARAGERPAAAPNATAKAEEIVTLPRVVVHGAPVPTESEAPAALPRMRVRPAGKDVPADPFETPAARDARLVKKHLSAFDRLFLNRFNLGGVSKEKRARDAEAIEQSARALNDAADLLELNRHEGPESAEEHKLRQAYLEAYLSRPR